MIINHELSSGASSQLLNGTYHCFIESIWDLIDDAYEITRIKYQQSKTKWEEVTFTANLAADMRESSKKHDLPWYINTNDEVYDQLMLIGNISPKKAKKIDITVTLAMMPELYYAIECKIVAESNSGSRNGLRREYVNHGINRFIIDESYASLLPEGGMIGYIIAGSSEKIVGEINQFITNRYSERDHLSKLANGRHKFDMFQSIHICRKTNKQFTLNHMFLNFVLLDKPN